MTRLVLVRHGTTDAVGHRLVGRAPGVPLNAEGATQARTLATRFAAKQISAIHSSPLERAVATAEAIAAPHRLQVQTRPGLTDLDFGDWTGKALNELRSDPHFARFNRYRSGTSPPAGESAVELLQRMVREAAHARAQHPDGVVVCVSHADPIRTLVAYFLGMPMDWVVRLEIEPGAFSELDLWEDWARVVCMNVRP